MNSIDNTDVRDTEHYDEGVDSYISQIKPELQAIANELRHIIHETEPDVFERILFNQPWFLKNGRLCYIRGIKDYVALGFQAGRYLTDPDGILEGSGKAMRHLKIHSLNMLDGNQIKAWIKEAVKLNTASDKDELETLFRTSLTGKGDE